MVQFIAEYLGWVVAVVGAVGTLIVVARKGGRAVRNATTKANQVSDVLLGRPAIVHPETGEELVPETPGIGTRMATIEQWQANAGEILQTMAETQAELVKTNSRVMFLNEKLDRHLESCPYPQVIPAQHVEVNVEPKGD